MIPENYFEGAFISGASDLKQKLKNIKAFVFDWDGVFNDGRKDINGNSGFSEVDSMGVNMMRFSYYLQHNKIPLTYIITGETNSLAISFAKREHLDAVFYKMKNKKTALDFICGQQNIQPEEVLYVFDDVLDFAVANLAGVRMMIGRTCNTLLTNFAINNDLVDYITKHDGEHHAVREVSELVMLFCGNFDTTIEHRMHYSEAYKTYITQRNNIDTQYFVLNNHQIIQDITV